MEDGGQMDACLCRCQFGIAKKWPHRFNMLTNTINCATKYEYVYEYVYTWNIIDVRAISSQAKSLLFIA